ncbi:CDP-alcohol phosphatidyltransferase family protein [Klebsiella pneumoniae]|nr:CDP-alcohol phosphatidyltransferase family protein [Klebsiella pneumoniae]MBD7636023.1 CDP-alcohol phosphatidyltransferase family protein [Klebsiella pneumoniae]
MLDSHLHPRLKPLLNAVAGALDRPGISPDGLTLVGFAIGVLALPFLALGWYGAALAAILLNRLLDALAGGWLLFAFIGTGSSFLAFAALAARHQIANPGYAHKSLYYLGGLTEGSETILLFVLGCLFPAHFAWLAWLFGALCWLTTATRICSGYQTLKRVTTTA